MVKSMDLQLSREGITKTSRLHCSETRVENQGLRVFLNEKGRDMYLIEQIVQ
jgi:hypothetical protein